MFFREMLAQDSFPRRKTPEKIFVCLGVQNFEAIKLLQDELSEHIPFMETPAAESHLTLFHYPKLADLYCAAVKAGVQVPFGFFVDQIMELSTIVPSVDSGITVYADCLNIYGREKDSKKYLGIKLQKSPEIHEIREPIIWELCRKLERMGMKNPWAFMRDNEGLNYHRIDNYNAHVTLGLLLDCRANLDFDIQGFPIVLGNPVKRISNGQTTLTLRS